MCPGSGTEIASHYLETVSLSTEGRMRIDIRSHDIAALRNRHCNAACSGADLKDTVPGTDFGKRSPEKQERISLRLVDLERIVGHKKRVEREGKKGSLIKGDF